MAKHPDLSAAAESLPLSIFARLYQRLDRFEGDVIPLQIGDTYLSPPQRARLSALDFDVTDGGRGFYRYAKPTGEEPLIQALVEKLRTTNQMGAVAPENIQVTCGATHALSCAIRATMDPGDEILLLTPYWPLIRGIARSVVVHPVEVPFSQAVLHRKQLDIEALIEKFVTPHTSAIYLCNPNNPDGLVLERSVLEAIGRVAQHHGLWVISDEVYELFTYDGRQHVSVASLPGMAERTMTTFSFSKSYAQAGLRVGYVTGPESAIAAVRKISNHTVYNVPRAMQRAALAALEFGDEFVREARARYQHVRDLAVATLDVPTGIPQGSTYLFVDLSEWVGPNEDSCLQVLERLAEVGVLLAPGAAFGERYANWARLCFTAVPEARLREGIERINRSLSGGGRI